MTRDNSSTTVSVHEPEDQKDHPVFRMFDRPIAFHRIFVDITGSIAAALMLSQAIYWSRRATLPGGWFYKTRDEWEAETGMTRYEQEGARKRLREFDWWQEESRKANGVPTMHYRINAIGLAGFLQTGWGKTSQRVGGKPANPIIRNTETTNKEYKELLEPSAQPPALQEKGEPEKKEWKEPTPHQELMLSLSWILFGHSAYATWTKEQGMLLGKTAKKLKEHDIGMEALHDWHLNDWGRSFFGLKGSRPTYGQLMEGMGRLIQARKDAAEAEQWEVIPAPKEPEAERQLSSEEIAEGQRIIAEAEKEIARQQKEWDAKWKTLMNSSRKT